MENPGLPEELWSHLNSGLWHATGCNGFASIIANGEIRVTIGDRYKSSFCRSQGAVCLFDFGPTAKIVPGRIDQMWGWFGDRQESRIAIWLEIDRSKVQARFWDAATARKKWDEPPYGEFIHGVEACHKGAIPLEAIIGIVLIARDNIQLFQQFRELPRDSFERIESFARMLPPPPPPNKIVEALLAGRHRNARSAESSEDNLESDPSVRKDR